MFKTEKFGELYGVDVNKYTLVGKNGLTVSVMNYGATITNILFSGKDLSLGYDRFEDYLHSDAYIGATVGRCCNRIGKGKFALNGKEYTLPCNENEFSHLHGGYVGFDKQLWDVVYFDEGDEPSVTFNHVFDDMEEGYPGELDVTVIYTVTENNALKIEYKAIASKDTVINFTNHEYFNLAGFDGGDILDTELFVNADEYTPYDEHQICTGEIKSVEGTPLDFRTAKPIGRDINANFDQLKIGGGYDNNFVLKGTVDDIKASAYCPKTKIKMSVKTDRPAIQLYTSNNLKDMFGKGGGMYKYQALCLETQGFPDAPNHPEFPSIVLPAETDFYSFTEYLFEQM